MNQAVKQIGVCPALVLLTSIAVLDLLGASALSSPYDPGGRDYTGRRGVALYVSKLGDNSDGSSWQKAFRTIQAALLAVPDDKGGHRIIVRPDTYVEANLYPAHKGAEGAYNLLIGDSDGSLGSGAAGRIVIDSGDPEKGFKSCDRWRTIRAAAKSSQQADPTFSSITWDRWILRNLYATGGDAGLFWDLTDKSGSEFTVIVEDCVGIGRAFGGGFGYPVAREKEPIVFRRCYLMCLDWGAGAGALGVGASNKSLPAYPDAVCEDCTFVSADNAVHVLRGPTRYTRVKFKDCRMIVLNFSPPHGPMSSGVICSDAADPQSGYLHADLEDSTLMGCRLFGTGSARPERISYTTKGAVRAYVQFRQPVPAGFQRLGLLPVDVLSRLAVPGNDGPMPSIPGTPKRDADPPVPGDPSAPGHVGRKGVTLYVSKQGDNSDGSSWQKAFQSVQAALLAVPDAQGGHRVIIRPDTYVEANLYPSHKGAPGAYNLLVGDCDGSLGSGAAGWVVIDSSCPGVAVRMSTWGESFKIVESKEPESGLKSCDWWGPWRCNPHFSGAAWDRWIYRNLYATGSEGGIGWDMVEMTPEKGAAFSAVVENCIGIGRFAGACVAAHTARKDEPVLFRHCYFMNLDRWMDDGGVYVRSMSRSMPDCPDATFEDCTIVGPANAFQTSYPTCDRYTRVKFKDCRLIVLNFSQPRLSHPYDIALVCCDLKEGKQLHVDFEDTTLMGYKLFCAHTSGVSYTTKGKVQAYVQFEQTVPKGFQRLGVWPVRLFANIAPPGVPSRKDQH